MSKESKEVKVSTILIAVAIFLVAYFLIVAGMFYGLGVENNFIKKTLKFLPLPAVFVGSTNYVLVGEVENELAAVKSFYENQDFSELGYRVDFSTEDGQKRLMIKKRKLLNKLIENEIIKILADKKNIKINNEIVSQEVERNIEQYGNIEDVRKSLKKLYGWDLNDFKEKIVKPDMYKEELSKYVRNGDDDSVNAKNKADLALKELKEKNDFTEVVSRYSEGESAKKGGELGWLSADQMIPEIAISANLMEKESISNVIETSLGFHIIKLEDKKNENNVKMFKLSQVFIKAKNLSDWLIEEEKNINIYIPLKDFYWDKERQEAMFRDKKLEDFERKLNENSAGDISVMF